MRSILLAICLFIFQVAHSQTSALVNKVICVDAGHGGTAATDHYRVGSSGEREEWVNLRVAEYLKDLLEKQGAKVIMTRTDDSFIPLQARSDLAKEHKVDAFVSIHHNATADTSVNFPIIYFHSNASENKASVSLATLLGRSLRKHLFQGQSPISVVSDFTVFAGVGASVLRHTYGIPAILAEASFFTNPTEESRLRNKDYNQLEALAYVEALNDFFTQSLQVILPKNSIISEIPPFKVYQEAERMTPDAKLWKQKVEKGRKLRKKKASWQQAYDLFTQSARAFPDSYLAAECHKNRALLLKKMGSDEESKNEFQRLKEYYVQVK